MATNTIVENDVKTQTELDLVNEVYDFVSSTDSLPSEDEVLEEILKLFSNNSQTILKTKGSPYYTTLQAQAKFAQINAGIIKQSVSKMLYTQSNGDDLSLASANFGVERIEAKASTIVASITTDKDITLNANSSFTDGGDNVWVTTQAVSISKGVATRVSLTSIVKGAISYIAPLKLTNPIAGITLVDALTDTIIVGREQESDTELKETLSLGISVFGGDSSLRRALLSLQMVNSAFVKTNPTPDDVIIEGNITLHDRERYVCIRSSNETLSVDEADSVALTIIDNTIYNPLTPRPADNQVKQYFGVDEETFLKATTDGGLGLTQADTSNCIFYRFFSEYNNYVDIYFYLATATDIDIILEITYTGNYEANEKENLQGNIKTLVSQTISELAQVGNELTISAIIYRLYGSTDLTDKIEIRSALLRKHGEQETAQYLQADSFEYFRIYTSNAEPYAGIVINEVSKS